MEVEKFLVVGLGNPGDRYLRTWHNLGFMALEVLSQIYGIEPKRAKFRGLYEKLSLAKGEAHAKRLRREIPNVGRRGLPPQPEREIIFLKPMTYMNLSGESVAAAARFFKIPPERILVFYDDVDIPLGEIRIRSRGSAGTHNGMRSVVCQLHSQDFPRIRIGCGPQPEQCDIVDFVLEQIPKSAQGRCFESLELASTAARLCFYDGADFAQNYINTLLQKK
ncbi:MAG: aminoacyl-tRNA hydrolase [Eubacteriales bacterium]|nr:aminoacyl-tRNA hydrolase [Eubacteriales bacterium]